ncbi:hypothetical protein MN116_001700 [Schistosoma mekongi]|uniref:Uncharacterized protein n=1 Tax=Schistosoma mekongi TaxID=38744 RepID=A0AAE1ZIN4_SCHME|nr:hypothetical protein MN116_001700 [Schistosoma mekongi]
MEAFPFGGKRLDINNTDSTVLLYDGPDRTVRSVYETDSSYLEINEILNNSTSHRSLVYAVKSPLKNPVANSHDTSIESLMGYENSSRCDGYGLTNATSQLWFEEIIKRLSCLMETSKDKLISIMELSDTGSCIPSQSSSSQQDFNDFSVELGIAAYTNSLTLEHWRHCLKDLTGQLISPVIFACLDILSKWPDNIDHQWEVCERNCLPNSFLSIAISYFKSFQCYCIPKATELLLDCIFCSCPNAELLATMNSLLQGWINSVSSCDENKTSLFDKTYCRNITHSNSSIDRDNPHSISPPPLTAHLKDINTSYKKVQNHLTSKAFAPFDTNSFCEYQPISPIVHFQIFRARTSDPGHKCEHSSNLSIQTGKSRRYTISGSFRDELHYINGCLKPSRLLNSNKFKSKRKSLTTVYAQRSNCHSYRLSDGISTNTSTHYRWRILESYDLALVCQLVLLFLPPVIFSRLKIMVDLLRRVLSNHERLASWLADSGSYENAENKHRSILKSDTTSTLEITLRVLVKHFGPLLLRVSSDLNVGETSASRTATTRIRWRECLLCLLLCDEENFLLTSPSDLQSCLRSVNKNIGNDNLKEEQENILHIKELIGLISSKSHASRKSHLAHLSSPSPSSGHIALPACIPSLKSALNIAGDSKGLKLNSLVNPIEFASTPAKNVRSSSLECSSRSVDNLNCRRILDQNNLDIGNLSLKSCSTELIHDESLGQSGQWSAESSFTGSTSSIFFQSDPKRLALLGNTAHLIKLLNQILNDRDMNPRRKMKCIQDFRKSHPDVFWLRFGTEEKADSYLSRLQRRIDSQIQPSVFGRITNALRRRIHSPVKQQE